MQKIILLFVFLTSTVVAQDQIGTLPVYPSSSPATMGGNITRRFVPGPEVSGQGMRIIKMQIPGFQPDDVLTHNYSIIMFHASGYNSGSTWPDEDGRLELAFPDLSGSANPLENEQMYLVSRNLETGELRFTLDVQQAELQTFLNSVNMQLRMMNPQSRPGTGARPSLQNNFFINRLTGLQGHSFTLYGEQLSVDELLDAIYLDTRCLLEVENQALVLRSCQ